MQMPPIPEVNLFFLSAIFPSTLLQKVIEGKIIPGKPFTSKCLKGVIHIFIVLYLYIVPHFNCFLLP